MTEAKPAWQACRVEFIIGIVIDFEESWQVGCPLAKVLRNTFDQLDRD